MTYLTYEEKDSPIMLKSFTKQLFRCVNVSNVCFPWYAPIPLRPTPPNGRFST